MLRKPSFVTAFVTGWLVLYYILFNYGVHPDIITAMFLASPFLMVWLVITILKYGQYNGPELGEDEEWGYQDREK